MNPIIRVPRYEDGVPGLPDAAIAFSNSERQQWACLHRGWLRHVEGLVTSVEAPPLRYGNAWHEFLADRHRWWMDTDSPYPPGAAESCAWCAGTRRGPSGDPCTACKGTGHGPVARSRAEWRRLAREAVLDPDAVAEDSDRLARAVEGYLEVYGPGPMDAYRVVGVEMRLAMPVLNGSGQPYCPETWIVPLPRGKGWRLARTGEAYAEGAKVVRWPWHQVMTLDAAYQQRSDPSRIWIYEGKSSADPERRLQDLLFESQVPGYAAGIRHAAKAGLFDWLPADGWVCGYVFDVASNRLQRDPDQLKPERVKLLGADGQPYKVGRSWAYEVDEAGEPVLRSPGLSRATTGKGASVPSWRYLAEVRRLGLDETEYRDHVGYLAANVDPKLYARDFPTCGPEVVSRYLAEVHGIARLISTARRNAATAKTRRQIDERFPRTPVCTLPGGTCPLRGPCLQDGELVRRDYQVAPTVEWHRDADTTQYDLGW